MAIRDNLYNQLRDMQKRYYDQQFSKNYVPGQENMMLTSQPAYDQMKAVYEAEQNVPESSWWNPASWNLFGSAEGSEMLPNSNYEKVNDDIPLNDPFAPFGPWELGEYGPGPKPGVTNAEILSQGTDSNISQGTDYNNWYDYLNPKKWGESFYDLTQPGNPDPWQLAKEIGPIYRDKLPSLFANPSELERDFPGSVPNLKEPNPLLDRLNESLGIVDRTTLGSDTAFANPSEDYDYEGNFRPSNHPDWWGKREFNPEKYNSLRDAINSSDERANVLTDTNIQSNVAPKNYNTGTPPEWMVGLDPMGKRTLPKGELAQGLETLIGKLPSVQMLSNLSQIMPVNERAIMEQNLGNQGIYTDDIGRIVQAGSDYNDPRNVMAGYNPIKMTDKTFTKRTDRIEKTLRDKYGLTDQDIADINAGSFDQSKFDFETDLIDRYKNIKQSGKVIMQQKEFAKKMADQRRENKKANRALVKQKQMTRAQDREDRRNIQQTQQYTGRPLSDYRMSRPASERRHTGAGKSGMGRNNPYYADGGRVRFANGGLASLFTRRG